MGAALFWFTPLVDPYLTGSILSRAGGPGGARRRRAAQSTRIACFLTGAFVLDD